MELLDGLHRALSEIAAQVQKKSTVFILNRYTFGSPDRSTKNSLKHQFPMLDISFLTAHGSKGLEADYVIIVNIGSGEYGFPTGVSDDPLYNLVLAESDKFKHAEERRLFYVSLTRARNSVYLIQSPGSLSPFIAEILKDKTYQKRIIGKDHGHVASCPVCKTGILTKKKGAYGDFCGCSNYPHCTYKEALCPQCHGILVRSGSGKVSCTQCSFESKVCPRCKTGILVKRKSKYGPFYGCSMYNHETIPCGYTVSKLS
jgi:DNA helicase IV